MNVLICGGRDFNDREKVDAAMAALNFTPDIIIQGGARGADRLGERWARNNHIHFATVPALWHAFDKAAGGKRNGAMLFLKIDYCVAFPGGTGTADMVKKCRGESIPTWLPYGV